MVIATVSLPGPPLFWEFVVPYLLGLVVSVFAVPLARLIAVRSGWYDRPDAGLKPHQQPIPYLGGVGIWLGWLAVLIYVIARREGDGGPLVWIAAAGTGLMIVGLLDDLRNLSPKVRLLAQAAMAVLILYGGVGHGVFSALIQPWQASLPAWLLDGRFAWAIDALFCIGLLIGASNSTNLIDGLDGLCGGVIGIAALGFWAMTMLLWTHGGGREMDAGLHVRIALCGALVGTCSAFLAYNLHPAVIFMGDSGSLLLGFNTAVMIVLLTVQGSWRGLVGALLVFGFPILDTSLAVARRWLNGRPLFVGDRSHFYDQLRDRGLSVRGTVYVCYALAASFAVLGCICVLLPSAGLIAVAVGAPLVAAIACRQCGLLRVDDAAERSRESGPNHG